MRLNARPHINGNSPDNFVDAALDLLQAAEAASMAMGMVLANVTHGRNYQHLGQLPAAEALDADRARVREIAAAVDHLRRLSDDILAASDRHPNRNQAGHWVGEVANENGWTP